MKAVILAGGRGTRISEESHLRPKPMVEIGGQPILWHIMKMYARHGICDFVVCLGYRGYMIKEYFTNYFLHRSDVTIDVEHNEVTFHDSRSEPWRVTLVDTGDATPTGGRIRRAQRYLDPGEPFCLAYGDGVSDIDIGALVAYHRAKGLAATMAVVRPPARFGSVQLEGDRVGRFDEKPQAAQGLINGGFFVLSPGALDEIHDDSTPWERGPLERLARKQQLAAFLHEGFWQPMDTLRERELLEELWAGGAAPWCTWD
jgi:glucose-1-phosphate cytidylyltransferase